MLKRIVHGEDWIARLTNDTGREAQLWHSGVFARMPAEIDPAILAARSQPGGDVLVMRNVSEQLCRRTAG